MPALARRDPGDLLRPARRPGDERVVGVGDDLAVGRLGQGVPPAPGDQPDLGRPVHLVPAQVQQRDHLRAWSRRSWRAGTARRPPGRRTGRLRAWPSADASPASMFAPNALDATSWPSALERRGDQPGGGGLAVRPGHQHDLAARRQQPEQVGLHPQAHDAADHRPVAAARQPRHPSRGTADGRGQARAQRKLSHGRRCYPATGVWLAGRGTAPTPPPGRRPPTMNRRGQDSTGLQPADDPHLAGGLAQLPAVTHADHHRGQVVGEAPLLVLAEQDGPGRAAGCGPAPSRAGAGAAR